MRYRALLLILLSAGVSSAAVRAVLPGCCSNIVTLQGVDPSDGSILNSFAIGPLPLQSAQGNAFALSADGNVAYIAVEASDDLGATSSEFLRLSLKTGQVTATLPVPGAALSVAINPVTGAVFATYSNGASYTLAQLNPVNLAIVRSNAVVSFGPQMRFSPSGERIYLGGEDALGFQVLRASDLTSLAMVDLPYGGLPIPSVDGSTIYVLVSSGGGNPPASVLFIDAKTFQTVNTLSLGNDAFLASPALSPDGGVLYFGESIPGLVDSQSALAALNLAALTVATVPLPSEAESIAVAADNTAVYLACGQTYYDTTSLVVYSPQSQATEATYPTLGSSQVAIDPTGDGFYELLAQSSALSVTEAAPSAAIGSITSVSESVGFGAYDAADGLLFIPATGCIEIYDSAVRPKACSVFPPVGDIAFAGGVGYAVGASYDAPSIIYQFDPTSMAVQGSVQLPYENNSSGAVTGYALSASHLYVTDTYSPEIGDAMIPEAGFDVSYIHVIDTTDMQLVDSWRTAYSVLSGIAIAGRTGYVVGYGSAGVYLTQIDLASGARKGAVKLANVAQGSPSNPVVLPNGATVYVANGTELLAVDTATLEVQGRVTISSTEFLSLTPDGSYLYSAGFTGYSILSTTPLAVIGSIAGSGFVPAIFVGR